MSTICRHTRKAKLSELDAQLIVISVRVGEFKHRKMGEIKRPRRYYKCEFCNSFHTTSQEQLTEMSSPR